jgi:hypothetical protein
VDKLSVSNFEIRVSCGPAVSFLFWSYMFLVGELSVSYFEIRVSCGRTVSILNFVFLWTKYKFLILKLVFLVVELSVSYFGVTCFLWTSCQFLIFGFLFLIGEVSVSHFGVCFSHRRTQSAREIPCCVRTIVVLKFAYRFETAAVQTFDRRFTTTE